MTARVNGNLKCQVHLIQFTVDMQNTAMSSVCRYVTVQNSYLFLLLLPGRIQESLSLPFLLLFHVTVVDLVHVVVTVVAYHC